MAMTQPESSPALARLSALKHRVLTMSQPAVAAPTSAAGTAAAGWQGQQQQCFDSLLDELLSLLETMTTEVKNADEGGEGMRDEEKKGCTWFREQQCLQLCEDSVERRLILLVAERLLRAKWAQLNYRAACKSADRPPLPPPIGIASTSDGGGWKMAVTNSKPSPSSTSLLLPVGVDRLGRLADALNGSKEGDPPHQTMWSFDQGTSWFGGILPASRSDVCLGRGGGFEEKTPSSSPVSSPILSLAAKQKQSQNSCTIIHISQSQLQHCSIGLLLLATMTPSPPPPPAGGEGRSSALGKKERASLGEPSTKRSPLDEETELSTSISSVDQLPLLAAAARLCDSPLHRTFRRVGEEWAERPLALVDALAENDERCLHFALLLHLLQHDHGSCNMGVAGVRDKRRWRMGGCECVEDLPDALTFFLALVARVDFDPSVVIDWLHSEEVSIPLLYRCSKSLREEVESKKWRSAAGLEGRMAEISAALATHNTFITTASTSRYELVSVIEDSVNAAIKSSSGHHLGTTSSTASRGENDAENDGSIGRDEEIHLEVEELHGEMLVQRRVVVPKKSRLRIVPAAIRLPPQKEKVAAGEKREGVEEEECDRLAQRYVAFFAELSASLKRLHKRQLLHFNSAPLTKALDAVVRALQ